MTLVSSWRCRFPGVSFNSEGHALVRGDPEGNSERKTQHHENTVNKQSR